MNVKMHGTIQSKRCTIMEKRGRRGGRADGFGGEDEEGRREERGICSSPATFPPLPDLSQSLQEDKNASVSLGYQPKKHHHC